MAGKLRLVFVILAIIIILALASFVFVLPGPRNLGTQYLKECSTMWPPKSPGPNTTQLQTLAAMTANPGSTGTICVEYNSSNSSSITVDLGSSIYFQSNMTAVPSSLVQVTTQPAILKAPVIRGESPSPVAYAAFTLNISSSAKGFYMLALDGFCPLIPLAIGYSQINYTDFAFGWQHMNQCSEDGLFGSYVSVSNISLAYSYVPLNSS